MGADARMRDGSPSAARLRELMDDRGWAEGVEAKRDATFAWMKEATAEIVRLHGEIASLRRTLDVRTEDRV